jgi:acyl-CoA synthetase (AMP-forming)/AMP-acid ligase II
MASMSRELLSPAALVDKLAAEVPDNVWVKIPVSSGERPVVWHDITWTKLRKAVDSMACWMESELGVGGGDEPLAYLEVNDLRTSIVIMAALKVGYKVRFHDTWLNRLPCPDSYTELFDLVQEFTGERHCSSQGGPS